jgi:uncharacterized coiled-coil DUF342 family protein
MKYSLLFAITLAPLVTSCEKHNALIKQSAIVESELNNRQTELKSLDARLATIGAESAKLKGQLETLLETNSKLETEVSSLSATCTTCEQTLKEIRSQVDSYKAKFVR